MSTTYDVREGVDASGVIAPAALARTLAATARYAAVVRELGAERVRFVATSASRDARNAGQDEIASFFEQVMAEDSQRAHQCHQFLARLGGTDNTSPQTG